MTEINQMLTLDDVKARRRLLADEDRVLASIEDDLVRAADKWKLFIQGHYTESAVPSAAASVVPPQILAGGEPTIRKRTRDAEGSRKRTKNDMLIEAMDRPRPLWQTSNDIQAYVSDLLGEPYPMSSVSPALTALKKDGVVVRKEMLVALALRVEKEEPGFLEAAEPPQSAEHNMEE